MGRVETKKKREQKLKDKSLTETAVTDNNDVELKNTDKKTNVSDIVSGQSKTVNFLNKYIIIHLDEKWKDIDSICNEFANQILIFQKKITKIG